LDNFRLNAFLDYIFGQYARAMKYCSIFTGDDVFLFFVIITHSAILLD